MTARHFPPRPWTDGELRFLADWFPAWDVALLAAVLDRTPKAVRWRAESLGIKRAPHVVSEARSIAGAKGLRALYGIDRIPRAALRRMPELHRVQIQWSAQR